MPPRPGVVLPDLFRDDGVTDRPHTQNCGRTLRDILFHNTSIHVGLLSVDWQQRMVVNGKQFFNRDTHIGDEVSRFQFLRWRLAEGRPPPPPPPTPPGRDSMVRVYSSNLPEKKTL